MNYVVHHWNFDPTLVVVLLTVVAHEMGLSRLRTRSLPARTRRRRRNSILFYAGLASLVISIQSPLDYWAGEYFFVHMLTHLILSFLAPALIVAGAPWIPLLFALPVGLRRSIGRYVYLSPGARGFRALGQAVRSPWTALVSFNATMLLWHIPSLFELSERNAFVHIWLMHTSFLVTGVLFWLQIIPSHPMKPSRGPLFQAGAIVITNLAMTVLAIAMSILTAVSWYANYAHLPGVTLAPFADQQIGAAILWVCGDFWAFPALYIIVRRALEDGGSLGNVLDHLMKRDAGPTVDSFRAGRLGDAPARPIDSSEG